MVYLHCDTVYSHHDTVQLHIDGVYVHSGVADNGSNTEQLHYTHVIHYRSTLLKYEKVHK